MPETGFKYRDALRLLFILAIGAESLEGRDAQTGAEMVFEGEKRLMAIDFWVRYPDHLAEKLLDLYEASGDGRLIAEVESIFQREEPDLRMVKMLRWRRGAYDRIDDALAVLASRDLIFPRRNSLSNGGGSYEYLIAPEAGTFLERCIQDQPTFSWYRDRTNLVVEVAGLRSGTKLKESQYEVPEYRLALQGAYIPSIADRVRQRLQALRAGTP